MKVIIIKRSRAGKNYGAQCASPHSLTHTIWGSPFQYLNEVGGRCAFVGSRVPPWSVHLRWSAQPTLKGRAELGRAQCPLTHSHIPYGGALPPGPFQYLNEVGGRCAFVGSRAPPWSVHLRWSAQPTLKGRAELGLEHLVKVWFLLRFIKFCFWVCYSRDAEYIQQFTQADIVVMAMEDKMQLNLGW